MAKQPEQKSRVGIVAVLIVGLVAAGAVWLAVSSTSANVGIPALAQMLQPTELRAALPELLEVLPFGGQSSGEGARPLPPVIGQSVSAAAAVEAPPSAASPTASTPIAATESTASDLLQSPFGGEAGGELTGSLFGQTEQLEAAPLALDDLYAQAEAAFAQRDWTNAVELYDKLLKSDASYQAVTVEARLGDAYRELALEELAVAAADGNLEPVRRSLQRATEFNPEDVVASTELRLVTDYLAAQRLLQFESPDEAVTLLEKVYRERPTYLNGMAAEQLYTTYLQLGDLAVRQSNLPVARGFYEQAKTVLVDDYGAVTARFNKLNDLIYLTPTPYPRNLATVQANALARSLPPVLLETPTPASPAEATGHAQFATAMALTTGTTTPVPESYVTPMLVVGPPPAENVATEAARVAEATARYSSPLIPTATPLPYNAVMAEYIYATPLPGNAATAEAQTIIDAANAQLYGTPTPLPWNALVITPVPSPPTPTSTPLPLLIPESELTPTPTVTPTVQAPDVLPVELRNKIVFLSDRGGGVQTYAMDPATGSVSLVTESWVHPLAREQLALAPGGRQEAQVLADSKRVLQIQVHSNEYGTTRQVTNVSANNNPDAIAYDPAWSPTANVIAFVSSEVQGDEIYTVNVDTGAVQRLTNNAWEWDKHPTWSPDGSQIVFYSNRETGRRQLWIMNADGSNPRNLSNNDFEDWDPIWVH